MDEEQENNEILEYEDQVSSLEEPNVYYDLEILELPETVKEKLDRSTYQVKHWELILYEIYKLRRISSTLNAEIEELLTSCDELWIEEYGCYLNSLISKEGSMGEIADKIGTSGFKTGKPVEIDDIYQFRKELNTQIKALASLSVFGSKVCQKYELVKNQIDEIQESICKARQLTELAMENLRFKDAFIAKEFLGQDPYATCLNRETILGSPICYYDQFPHLASAREKEQVLYGHEYLFGKSECFQNYLISMKKWKYSHTSGLIDLNVPRKLPSNFTSFLDELNKKEEAIRMLPGESRGWLKYRALKQL